jgi:hypothetical protein
MAVYHSVHSIYGHMPRQARACGKRGFVLKGSSYCVLQDEDGRPMEIFMSMDGEAIAWNGFHNENILQLLVASAVLIGKLPASTSAILQPSDVAPTFKVSKAYLQKIIQNNQDVSNRVVQSKIMDAMSDVAANFGFEITEATKHRYAYGCLAVASAVLSAATPMNIRQGFRDSGQYPLDFNKMLGNCYRSVDNELRKRMEARLEGDLILFRQQGYLTEEQYEDSGIDTLDVPDGKPRDERAIQNQRALLINHPATVKRRRDVITDDPQLQQILMSGKLERKRKQELIGAMKILKAEETKKRKKEERDAKRQAMSPGELAKKKTKML